MDVALVDVKDSVLLKAELKVIEQETSKAVGRGPTYHDKRTRCHHRELQKAAQLGQDQGQSQGQSQLPPQTQNIQPLSQAQSSQPLSQVHSSNLLSQTQCSQPCTSLIAMFPTHFKVILLHIA